MKSIIFTLFFVFLLGGVQATDETLPDIQDVGDDIAAAIRAGNASRLGDLFSSTVNLSVPGNDGSFSKAQAEIIMNDFFKKYPPSSFSVTNQGSSAGGSLYTVGTYVSGKSTFRTYYLIKNFGSSFQLQILKFEQD